MSRLRLKYAASLALDFPFHGLEYLNRNHYGPQMSKIAMSTTGIFKLLLNGVLYAEKQQLLFYRETGYSTAMEHLPCCFY